MLNELTRLAQEKRNARIALELEHHKELERQDETHNVRIRSAIAAATNDGISMDEVALALGYKRRQSVYQVYGKSAMLKEPVNMRKVESDIQVNGDFASVDGYTYTRTDGVWLPETFLVGHQERTERLLEHLKGSEQ